MKLSKPAKIIIGLVTAWVMVTQFLFFGILFLFILGLATGNNPAQVNPNVFPAYLPAYFSPFFLVLCSSFLQIGLQAFYIIHVILNKSGGDVIRSVLAVGIFIFAIIAMPVYYFIFILPDNPPQWALASSGEPVDASQDDYPRMVSIS